MGKEMDEITIETIGIGYRNQFLTLLNLNSFHYIYPAIGL